MTRRNPYASALATIAKRLITATATRVYTPLYDEPISLPDGRYDILTCFFPSKTKPGSGFRVFRVAMYFLPAGVAGAPRCLRLEDA